MEAILSAIIAAIATIVAAWVSRPRSSQPASQQPSGTSSAPDGTKISSSLIFGAIGFVAWLLPIVGLPIALIGIGFGISHLSDYPQRRFARSGIWLNVICLMASVANSAIGFYMGYNGEFPWQH